jgi:PAS domain S-box-containing protein
MRHSFNPNAWTGFQRDCCLLCALVMCFVVSAVAQEPPSQSIRTVTAAEIAVLGKKKPEGLFRFTGTMMCETAPGFCFFLDHTGSARVRMLNRIPVVPGDLIEMTGTIWEYNGGWMGAVTVEKRGKGNIPAPIFVRADEATVKEHNLRYVTVRGQVLERTQHTSFYIWDNLRRPHTVDVLVVNCDGVKVNVMINQGTQVPQFCPPGTVAEFTGMCRLEVREQYGIESRNMDVVMSGMSGMRLVSTAPLWMRPEFHRWVGTALYGLSGAGVALVAWMLWRWRRARLLRANEVRYRALVETSFDGTMIVRPDGSIKYMSPGWRRLLGLDADSALADNAGVAKVIHPDDLPLVMRAQQEVLAKPGGTRRIPNYRVRTADGTWLHVEAIGRNCLDVPGVEGVVVNVHDITDRILAEETLRHLNADLEKRVEARTDELHQALSRERELGEMKSSFVSMVSHEFRTPLGVIMSATDVLQRYFERLAPDKRARHLDMIFRSTRNLANLMEEVLLLGRVEEGRMQFAPISLDLERLCRGIVDELVSATGATTPIHFSCLTLLEGAVSDEGLLRSILSNLISNAVKYSEPGTPVEFTALRRERNVVFTIKDRGIGIPKADQARLFTSFTRGSNVGERPGTGLGLVVVQRCVALHGGELQLESEPGIGTVITVALPVFP